MRDDIGQLSLFEECKPPVKSIKKGTEYKLFIDGASRNNPGPAGAGIYLLKDDNAIVVKKGYFLGTKTNNQAEYLALVLGIHYAKKHMNVRNDCLLIFSDSELLVKQVRGQYRVRNPELKKIHNVVLALLNDVTYSLCHVLREYNQDADSLANHGVDKKTHVPADIVKLLQEHEIIL